MVQDKLVSVIIPTYNSAKFLYESIYSIVNQSYKNLEIIIVDDTPIDDGTKKILDSFCDERIVYVKPEKRLGMVTSLNYAISISHGDYIARMDADDISHKDRFAKQVEYLNSHINVGVVGSAYYTIDETDRITGVYSYPQYDNEIKVKMFFNTALAHPTVMMRKSLIEECRYNENCYCCEDYELWSRMMGITQFHNLQERLFKYRLLENSAMRSQLSRLAIDEEYYKKHTSILKIVYDNILTYFNIDISSFEYDYIDMLFAKRINAVPLADRVKFLVKCKKLLKGYAEEDAIDRVISYQWLKMSNSKFWKSKQFAFSSLKVAVGLYFDNKISIIQGIIINNRKKYNWKI